MLLRGRNKIATTARKVRADKKRQIAPTIEADLKREIERFAYILNRPIKDTGIYLCREGLSDGAVISELAAHFQRGSLRFGSTVYRGDRANTYLGNKQIGGKTGRISMRFESDEYEDMRLLADLLDVTVARATGYLLAVSMTRWSVIERALALHGRRLTTDEDLVAEIKRLKRYVQ